jgi:hypothetical protein
MKKLLNFKNIAIAALIIYVLLQWFNPGGVMPLMVKNMKY